MTRSVEATGRNIEQAIENALFELKAPREDVDIKILSEGGLFKKAKVVVSISEDVIDKYEAREKSRKEEDKQTEEETKKEEKEKILKESEEIKAEAKKIKKEEKEAKKQEKKEQKEEEKAEKKSQEPKERMSCVEFVQGLIKAYGKDADISEIEEDEVIRINLQGEGLSELIGYRGEALFALSYLMSNLCKREAKKCVLDICGYRDKREQSLIALANRMASKVAKTGRYARLEPMDASERRIIHLALQDNDKVTTMSKGTEPKRYLIIFPREYKD